MHPLPMKRNHLFPAYCPRKLRIDHFSDGIEVTFDVVLLSLPLLDLLFSDPQSGIRILCLFSAKNPPPSLTMTDGAPNFESTAKSASKKSH
jgi:hypothetical protein